MKNSLIAMSEKLKGFVNHKATQAFFIIVVVLNAVVLGFSTYARFENLAIIKNLENIILYIFVFEIILKIIAFRLDFFKSKANVFDLIVVALCCVPTFINISILRLLRTFTLLRLFSAVPQLRFVIAVIFKTAPSAFYVGLVLMFILYIYAVLCVRFFGSEFPEMFGNLGIAIFSLFQISTLESWASGIAIPIMRVYPYSWIIFVSFILIVTFVLLNMIVGLIVDNINEIKEQKAREKEQNKDK